MKIFKTTVELCMEGATEVICADFLAESFREWLMHHNPILKDWQYAEYGGFISNIEEITKEEAESQFSEYGHY